MKEGSIDRSKPQEYRMVADTFWSSLLTQINSGGEEIAADDIAGVVEVDATASINSTNKNREFIIKKL